MNNLKKQKGMTLLALVITVIVLAILVGIAISAIV
ncbi:MAG: prepilin-type N-terminal cleavage/methylation domain-containing protein [Clostridia bacterium]|jgi:Tfp pilus assembly protein PilE